jgi:hypothetical protein
MTTDANNPFPDEPPPPGPPPVDSAEEARNNLAGPDGLPPPVDPLTGWVIADVAANGLSAAADAIDLGGGVIEVVSGAADVVGGVAEGLSGVADAGCGCLSGCSLVVLAALLTAGSALAVGLARLP